MNARRPADPALRAVDVRLDFAACYRRYRAFVHRHCLRFGAGDPSFAEDATQEVFLKLLAVFDTLHDTGALRGWLYRAATCAALSRLRSGRSLLRRVQRALSLAPPLLPPERPTSPSSSTKNRCARSRHCGRCPRASASSSP